MRPRHFAALLLLVMTAFCLAGHLDREAAVVGVELRQELLLAHWVGGESDTMQPYTKVARVPIDPPRECYP